MGAIECKASEIKTRASGWSGGINTVDTGNLEIWIGPRDSGFVEDGRWLEGNYMEHSDWDRLVKNNL